MINAGSAARSSFNVRAISMKRVNSFGETGAILTFFKIPKIFETPGAMESRQVNVSSIENVE